jgi:hypothetical protein
MGPLDAAASGALSSAANALALRGLDPGAAHRAAAAALDGAVNAEASMRSFQDVYVILAVGFLLSLPLVFGLARHAPGRAPAPAQAPTAADPVSVTG